MFWMIGNLDEKYGLVPGLKYVFFTKKSPTSPTYESLKFFDNFDVDLSSHSEMHYIYSMQVKLRFLEGNYKLRNYKIRSFTIKFETYRTYVLKSTVRKQKNKFLQLVSIHSQALDASMMF